LEQILDRCCGVDVHQAEVTACVRVLEAGGQTVESVRSFGTTTPDLLALRDWLSSAGVTHVAMESTGVYWKPVYYILEDEFELLLVNAAHIKHVPGRKTDVIDSAWIAQLLAHGLLRASFVPPKPIRRLRDITRYRKALIEERTREVNRAHKLLEDAGVKLATVATDVMGTSWRAMMEALIAGVKDPEAMAEMARTSLRRKLPQLRKALTVRFEDHHAFMLTRILAHIDSVDADIEALSDRIEGEIAPFEREIELLCTIPGVGRRSAQVIVAEIGPDMTQFPSAAHLASWAGICPGQNESAGKRKAARTRRGSRWLRGALTECGHAAARARGTYLSERYRQVIRRRGKKKAIVAVGHDILTTAWYLLSRNSPTGKSAPSSCEHKPKKPCACGRFVSSWISATS
jgi:transposase